MEDKVWRREPGTGAPAAQDKGIWGHMLVWLGLVTLLFALFLYLYRDRWCKYASTTQSRNLDTDAFFFL
jgi:hypothetical protein